MKPPRCPKREMVSSRGNILAPQVLRKIVKTRKANMMRVYCQLGKVKLESVTLIIVSTRVVTTKTPLTTLASHPRVDIHPADFSLDLLREQRTSLTRHVTCNLLIFWRCKFAYPMILSTACGGPAQIVSTIGTAFQIYIKNRLGLMA